MANTTTTGTGEAGNEVAERRSPRGVTLNLPFVTATFRSRETHLPKVRVPDKQEVLFAAHTVGGYLPSPRQAVYFGGLAALAAFEIIEWPIALAIGAGTAIMGRSESHESQRETRREPQPEIQAEPTRAATKGTTTSAKSTTTSVKSTGPAKPGGSSTARSDSTPPSS
jgi:hypothetical protein